MLHILGRFGNRRSWFSRASSTKQVSLYGKNPLKAKVTVKTLAEKRRLGQKITMVTAYDCVSATICEQAAIDMVLVGDSAAMVIGL